MNPLPTLSPQEQHALTDFVRRIRDAFGPQVRLVALYGSKARCDSGPDSDVDVLVVTSQDDWRLHRQIRRISADVSLDHEVLLSCFVISQSDYDHYQAQSFSFFRNLETEGIELTSDLLSTT